MTETKLQRTDLVYPELSYNIVGSLFDVWSELGFGHRESFYQQAVVESFKTKGINFQKELPVKILYQGKVVGTYRFDFLIEQKIVLELKVREYFSKHDIQQVYSYLKAKGLQLGLIAHFTHRGVKVKRVVNLD